MRISEASVAVQRAVFRWSFGVGCVGVALAAHGCVLPFDDYPEADLCAAAAEAGVDTRQAGDPALRGCEAGASPARPQDDEVSAAGAAEMGVPNE